jgi:hypothetical protein
MPTTDTANRTPMTHGIWTTRSEQQRCADPHRLQPNLEYAIARTRWQAAAGQLAEFFWRVSVLFLQSFE